MAYFDDGVFETAINKIHENMLKNNMDGALVELSSAIIAAINDPFILADACDIMNNEVV